MLVLIKIVQLLASPEKESKPLTSLVKNHLRVQNVKLLGKQQDKYNLTALPYPIGCLTFMSFNRLLTCTKSPVESLVPNAK